jgi:cysteine-rich repeat protein
MTSRIPASLLLLASIGCGPGRVPSDDAGETSGHEGDGDGDATDTTTTGSSDTETESSDTETESSDTETDTETGSPAATCGDAMVDADEECDLGEANDDSGACTSACTIATCGDGWVYEGFEECDDGNAVDDDACDNACALPVCGDGVREGDEDCDASGVEAPDCDPDCSAPACGDGYLNTSAGELCDDGNQDNSDNCPGSCEPAVCGDGYEFWAEGCDDGNDIDIDGCDSNCFESDDPLCYQSHPVLEFETRSTDFIDGPGGVQLCDRLDAPNKSPDWLGPGWYRIGDQLGHHVPTFPTEDYACGGTAGGWVDDVPNANDGIIEAELCFAFGDDSCLASVMVQGVRCNYEQYYLWQLPEAPSCDLRYCIGYIVPP